MESTDTFKTIAKPSEEVLFKEKKSKFYGYAFPLETDTDIKLILEELRKRFPKANHVCYAWQIGVEQKEYRANDDGEPNNSAGMPIYGQIQSFDVTNILVAVVRVFGGTKLGVGGLIDAYKNTAKLALEQASIIKRVLEEEFIIKCEYAEMNLALRLISKYKMRLVKQKLEINCEFLVAVRKGEINKILKKLNSLHKIQVETK